MDALENWFTEPSTNCGSTKRPPPTPHYGDKYHDSSERLSIFDEESNDISDDESNDAAPCRIPKKSKRDSWDSFFFPSYSSSLPPSCQSNSTASTDHYRFSDYDMGFFNSDEEKKSELDDFWAKTKDNTSHNS
jgi:hypothetical protein